MRKNFPLNLDFKKYLNLAKQWEYRVNVITHDIASLSCHIKFN